MLQLSFAASDVMLLSPWNLSKFRDHTLLEKAYDWLIFLLFYLLDSSV